MPQKYKYLVMLVLSVLLFSLFFAVPVAAQDSPDRDFPPVPSEGSRRSAALQQRSSPYEPPVQNDATFVVDSDVGLDTGCTFHNGEPLVFKIAIDWVIGDRDKLLLNKLIQPTAKLTMPAYDVDYDLSSPSAEYDRV